MYDSNTLYCFLIIFSIDAINSSSGGYMNLGFEIKSILDLPGFVEHVHEVCFDVDITGDFRMQNFQDLFDSPVMLKS